MKKFGKALIVSLLVSSMFVTTVLATPSESELRQQKAETLNQIESLESQMTSIMANINKAEEDLVVAGEKIIQATEDLKEAEEQEKQQYEAMKQRIVAMYENGNTSMIAMILESGSVAEMLKNAENVQSIHAYDREQLEEYVATKERISNLKVTLEEEQKTLEAKQASYYEDKEELDGMIAELEAKVDDYDVRIQQAAEAAAAAQQQQQASRPSGSTGSGNTTNNTGNSNSNYKPSSSSGSGSAIVSAAYRYLGVPYVWGGTSSSGVDCSGLVMLAHNAAGIYNIGRVSGSQGSGGRAVSKADRQPGDVVCYSGHVGIYVGGGQMIHAPHTGSYVKVVNVYGNPWYRRYW